MEEEEGQGVGLGVELMEMVGEEVAMERLSW